MKIYPAIDIQNGQCVRLYKGRFENVTTYKSVLQQAALYAEEGASELHLIDLDGAKKGRPVHCELLKTVLSEYDFKAQIGGGIRTQADIETLLAIGATRIILGSFALENPAQTKQLLSQSAEKIVLAFDFRNNEFGIPQIASHGWQQQHALSLWDVLDDFSPAGLKHVLITDINRDGTLLGPNIAIYAECIARYPQLHIQASGGVSSLSDIKTLNKLNLSAVIIGKALYEGKFSLSDAIREVNYERC